LLQFPVSGRRKPEVVIRRERLLSLSPDQGEGQTAVSVVFVGENLAWLHVWEADPFVIIHRESFHSGNLPLLGPGYKDRHSRTSSEIAIAAAEPLIPTGLWPTAPPPSGKLLFAIADLAGGRWPDLARQAAVALTATAQDRSPMGALLLDIFAVFLTAHTDRLFSRDLAAALHDLPDRPWAELRKGKAMDELWLAKQLHPYGVRPCNLRIGDRLAKGYTLDALKPIFQRYVPPAEIEALKTDLAETDAPTPIISDLGFQI